MSLILNGTDNSATTPSVQGSTGGTGTGVYYPATNAVALATNGTNAVYVTSGQNVGIGTSSPASKLQVGSDANNNTALTVVSANNTSAQVNLLGDLSGTYGTNLKYEGNGNYFAVSLNNAGSLTEQMRITSGGDFLVGGTTTRNGTKATIESSANVLGLSCSANVSSVDFAVFYANAGTVCGNIARVGTTSAVAYNTTSDYRLKENVLPFVNALDSVSKLKPCVYTWKDGGAAANGFIAHELQEICPDAVTGEKDAVNEDGTAKYQAIDQSKIVALLTAAMQELSAKVDAQAAEIAALKVGA